MSNVMSMIKMLCVAMILSLAHTDVQNQRRLQADQKPGCESAEEMDCNWGSLTMEENSQTPMSDGPSPLLTTLDKLARHKKSSQQLAVQGDNGFDVPANERVSLKASLPAPPASYPSALPSWKDLARNVQEMSNDVLQRLKEFTKSGDAQTVDEKPPSTLPSTKLLPTRQPPPVFDQQESVTQWEKERARMQGDDLQITKDTRPDVSIGDVLIQFFDRSRPALYTVQKIPDDSGTYYELIEEGNEHCPVTASISSLERGNWYFVEWRKPANDGVSSKQLSAPVMGRPLSVAPKPSLKPTMLSPNEEIKPTKRGKRAGKRRQRPLLPRPPSQIKITEREEIQVGRILVQMVRTRRSSMKCIWVVEGFLSGTPSTLGQVVQLLLQPGSHPNCYPGRERKRIPEQNIIDGAFWQQ